MLSRRALAQIDTDDSGASDDRYELAARLALAAGERRQAAELLLAVAQRALRAGALASAESALDAAADAAPAGDPIVVAVEESLVDVLSHAGDRDRAVAVGRSLLARLGDDEAAATGRALAHLRMARAAAAATRWDEVRERLDRARSEAAMARDEQLSCRVGALATLGQDDLEQAASLATSALVTAERLDVPEVMCEALEAIGAATGRSTWRQRRPRSDGRTRSPGSISSRCGDFGRCTLGTIDLLRDGDTARLERRAISP